MTHHTARLTTKCSHWTAARDPHIREIDDPCQTVKGSADGPVAWVKRCIYIKAANDWYDCKRPDTNVNLVYSTILCKLIVYFYFVTSAVIRLPSIPARTALKANEWYKWTFVSVRLTVYTCTLQCTEFAFIRIRSRNVITPLDGTPRS